MQGRPSGVRINGIVFLHRSKKGGRKSAFTQSMSILFTALTSAFIDDVMISLSMPVPQ